MLQVNYEQWLNNQNVALENQLKHFEDKITKIRKVRKVSILVAANCVDMKDCNIFL